MKRRIPLKRKQTPLLKVLAKAYLRAAIAIHEGHHHGMCDAIGDDFRLWEPERDAAYDAMVRAIRPRPSWCVGGLPPYWMDFSKHYVDPWGSASWGGPPNRIGFVQARERRVLALLLLVEMCKDGTIKHFLK